jgi:hypothetical protein
MYHDLSNCLTCGRLIAPTSGLYGPNNHSIFCCRRCLKEYYEDQPGLWDEESYEYELALEEEAERIRILELERDRNQLLEVQKIKHRQYKKLIRFFIYLFICFIIFLLIRPYL